MNNPLNNPNEKAYAMSDRQKKRFNPQDLIGLVAVVVATTAALAAIFQTQLMARHQAVSVWPYLQMFAGIAAKGQPTGEVKAFSFNIANKGVGPAIFETIDVRYKGEIMPGWRTVFQTVAEENNLDLEAVRRSISEANLDPGEVVQAGEIRSIIESDDYDLAALLARAIYSSRTVEVDVCFCSLYKECWRLVFPSSRPETQKTCEG